jgi:hypothetical protein
MGRVRLTSGVSALRASPSVARRCARIVVQAKVELQGGPRIIRGKCYVTRDVSLTTHRMYQTKAVFHVC